VAARDQKTAAATLCVGLWNQVDEFDNATAVPIEFYAGNQGIFPDEADGWPSGS
jgi:hypothetical protein